MGGDAPPPTPLRGTEDAALVADLKAGDKIVTTGGIIGTITAVRDTSFLVRSADKSILEIARSAVAAIDSGETK